MTKYIALDTETFPIKPGLRAPHPVVITLAEKDAPVQLLAWWEEGTQALIRQLLEDDDVVLVTHNGAYDFAVLAAADNSIIDLVFQKHRKGLVRDTKIRQELKDIAAGRRQDGGHTIVSRGGTWARADYSLAGLEMLYFERDRSAEKTEKSWRLKYGTLYNIPTELWPVEAKNYAKEDAKGTLEVFFAQKKEEPHTIINEVEQTQAAWALHLISCWGMRTDAATVEALEKDIQAKWAAIQEKLRAEGFFRIGGTKKAPKLTKDMAVIKARVEAAYRAQNLEAPRTEKGSVKTDADTLKNSGDTLLEELGEGGPISTVLKTFIPVLKTGVAFPINTNYSVLLNTGRVSSWQPNLNNISRDGGVRECYVPREGYYFCSTDYNSAELRAWAQVCYWLFGFSDMRDLYISNPLADPHLELAATIVGISAEEAKKRHKAKDKQIGAARQMCKALNFSLPTAVGAKKIRDIARKQYGAEMTIQEAYSYKAAWLRRWREGQRYYDFISERVDAGISEIMQLAPWVLKGKPHRKRGGVGYTDSANTLFQGLVADAAKEAMFRISWECYTGRTYDTNEPSPLAGSRIVVHLYDEHILEVPHDVAHEAGYRQAQLMVEGAQMYIPDVPIVCEPALMLRWSKKAETVFENERLVPWTPKQ